MGARPAAPRPRRLRLLRRRQHLANGSALFTAANTRDLAQDAVDDGRAVRDNNFILLSKLGVAFPGNVEGQFEEEDDFPGEVAGCRDIEVVSQQVPPRARVAWSAS